MKQYKGSFILKALIALVLALLMVFGTVSTSFAAVADDLADSGADTDIADSGYDADIADSGYDADIADSGWYYSNGDYRLKSSLNNWSETSNYVAGTVNSSNNNQHYFDVYLYGVNSDTENTTNWIYFRYVDMDDGNYADFGPDWYDCELSTSGMEAKQISGYDKKGSFYIKRKTLGTSSTTLYRVRLWLEHDGSPWAWYAKTTVGALSPSITTKKGTTSTTSFNIGDTVSLSTSVTNANKIGTVSYSYKYKKSTDSSYTSISGSSLDTTSLSAGTYTIQVTATDNGMVAGKNAQVTRTAETATKDITISDPTHSVTVATSGSGKTSTDGSTYTAANKTVSPSSSVAADIYAQADSGNFFTGWTKSANSITIADANALHTTITATADSQTVTANFAAEYAMEGMTIYLNDSASTHLSAPKVYFATDVSGANATAAVTPAETSSGSKIYHAQVPAETSCQYNVVKFTNSDGSKSSGWQPITSLLTNSITYDNSGWHSISFSEKSYNDGYGRIYFDNTFTNWSATGNNKIYFIIGRGNYIDQISMTKVTNTSQLYYANLSNWDNYTFFGFALMNSDDLPAKNITPANFISSSKVLKYTSFNSYYELSQYNSSTPKTFIGFGIATTGNMSTLDFLWVRDTYVDGTGTVSSSLTGGAPANEGKYLNRGIKLTVTGPTGSGSAKITDYRGGSGSANSFTNTPSSISTDTVNASTSGANNTKYFIRTSTATLNLTPATGAVISSVIVNGVDVTSSLSNNSYSFTVPGGDDQTGTGHGSAVIDVQVTYNFVPKTITDGGAKYKDTDTYTSGNTGGTLTVSQTGTINHGTQITVTARAEDGYNCDGIFWTTNGTTWTRVETTDTTSNGITTECTNNTFTVNNNYTLEARFSKVYKLSAFNSYEKQSETSVVFVTAPPKSITVTHGDTTYTYTYSGTAGQGNPDSPDTATATITKPAALAVGNGTYGQGNYIQFFAGDEIELHYSAMASSELIKGVFYNNTVNYYVEKPTPSGFIARSDYTSSKCLKAIASYYNTSISPYNVIPSQTYAATIDQDTHVVSFTGVSDYKNIDVELASKRRIYFSDTTGVVVTSKNIDNYYFDNEDITVTGDQLTVAAAQSSDLTTTIVGSGVQFFKANADGSKGDALTNAELTTYELTVTNATSTNTSSANGTALVIDGKMPPFDLYVELNATSAYAIKLGSKIVSDLDGSATRLASKATSITAGSLTAPTGSDVTSTSASVNTGTNTSLQVTGIHSSYMFVGWYWGNSAGTAPDYEKGFISDKESLSYTIKKSGTIWAVGTRDLFINGSKYITGKDSNWYSENGSWKNLKMEFDPSRGTKGSYYWDITDTMFNSAGSDFKYTESNSSDNGGSATEGKYYHGGDGNWYWCNNDDSKHGKAFFQFLDTETGYANRTVWTSVSSFNEQQNGARYGKIYPQYSGSDELAYKKLNGQGFIDFAESRYSGYSSPLRIYLDADTKDLDVEATPIYSDIYVSNGFTVGSTSRTSNVTVQPVVDGVVKTSGQTGYFSVGAGTTYSPDAEGTVKKYTPAKKSATVRITKTVGGNDKIEGFLIYELDNKTVRTEKNVTKDGSNYYIDLTLAATKERLYIIPIIEEDGADVTVTFDATQLNRAQWGDIVTAYAWYGTGNALGAYPGQPLMVSDDGSTWTAKFKSTKSGSSLTGITFTNMVDGIHSWFGCSGVMGTVTYGGAGTQASPTTVTIADDGIIKQYNYIESGTNKEFSRANFKAQTYDYREPIALYQNRDTSEGAETTITFAMKDGNSSLISWKHTDLLYQTPSTGTGTNDNGKGNAYLPADGTTPSNIINTSWPLNWEYLTTAKGDEYVDISGNKLGPNNKPTASFYVAAKGGVIYSNSTMTTVFHSGTAGNCYQQPGSPKGKDTDDKNRRDYRWTEAVTYGGASGVSMNYGVQWYVYDASGNYITTVLSAGFADTSNGMSFIADKLSDMGYPVTGKSVAICYDKPRYMYNDKSGTGVGINSESGAFNAYRFTGQWIAASNMDTVKVNVGVGMMTDSGEVLSATNTDAYGEAHASYDTSKGNTTKYSTYTSTASDGSYVQTAVGDAQNNPVKLTASSQNFIGWYYYDSNTGEFTKATYTGNDNFYPSYSTKDVTFYAMYRAAAVYNYIYTGREGSKTYSATGNDLTAAEMSGAGQNKVVYANHSEDVLNKLPVGIGVFKKNIDFSSSSASSWTKNNDTPYILKLSNFGVTTPNFTLTAFYKDANGDLISISKTGTYNSTAVDLTTDAYTASDNSTKAAGTAPSAYYNKPFLGWYTTSDGTTPGTLISTQHSYGLILTGNQQIIAVYDEASNALPTDGWHAEIDENEVNKELTTSESGVFYNDTIVRIRNGSDVKVTLPEGAKVGVLVIRDNKVTGAATAINGYNSTQLTTIANAVASGSTAKLRIGYSVTNLSTNNVTAFNRTDLAIRSDYKNSLGSHYTVYAYVKIGETYYFSDPSAINTYE